MSSTQNNDTGIAIIGMAGRFPRARNVDEFWQNLCLGVEGISFFTDDELESAGVDFPKNDSNYVKARGLLEDAGLFDAGFFGINPREAEVMDPQHRVFLECAWEALENAGCDPGKYPGTIGVFAGMSMNTYLAHNLQGHPELLAQLNEHQLMLGNDKDFLPSRVAYKLNLRGPALNIQTACSTSLVAICVACQNLLSYDCDAALAGAVSITFPQKRGYLYQSGGIASPDGHCRAFDAKAAGTVAGEGVGIVVLKRLEDALADGDTVYAVIRGFAINNDGANKVGYTAPSVEGQAEVIATAQAMAGFAPETIHYVEAHGTGTPLGDPIEIEGLARAFRTGTSKKNFCAIGTAKSSIGHLDVAAGVAGLIKTALALHHKKIPPSLHFEAPNPKIDFANSPFFVNSKITEWKNGGTPRRAGVSSFGIGGTNAHIVLEEAPPRETPSGSRPAQLIAVSAKTQSALDMATTNLANHLKQNPALNLADVAGTLHLGRREFAHRRMLICRDPNDAVGALAASRAGRVFTSSLERENPAVVFMFPGQGAQRVNMGIELYRHEPVFREQVARCSEMLLPQLDLDLRDVLYPAPENVEEAERQLTQTAITQPALFVIEYALAKLWMDWGVVPEAMIGHSIGEYVAACLAEVFTLEDALKLVAVRGQLMQQLPRGAMLAVRLPEAEVRPCLNDRVSLAAVNGAALCVVSGPVDAVESLRQEFDRRKVASKPLLTSHAFHSGMMEPALQPFVEMVKTIKRRPPQVPFISNVTGTWITAAQATDPDYWTQHLRRTVRFGDGLGELLKEPGRVLLEVGPGQTLSMLAKQHPARNPKTPVLSSFMESKSGASEEEAILTAVGQLWLVGVTVDWKSFYRQERRRRLPLPAYPFERKHFWIEPPKRIQTPLPESTETGTAPRADEAAATVNVPAPPGRAETVHKGGMVEALRWLLGKLSGLEPPAISGNLSFTEMGFESLFLTQFSVAMEKEFGVTVAFRQLLEEFSTLDTLAAHVELHKNRDAGVGSSDLEIAEAPPAPASTVRLTESQRELWFASQMSDSASCAYNECRLVQLRGDLNTKALLAAMQRLVERHEGLRTTIASSGESQIIHAALRLDVPRPDWSQLRPEEQAAQLDALQREEARRPFDLTGGPLLRSRLIRLHEHCHALVLTAHHIICDGHSLGVMLHELGDLYSAAVDEVRLELPKPLQLSEYVREQARQLERNQSGVDEDFWLKQFAGPAPFLELPPDHGRDPARTPEGAFETRLLPVQVAEGVKRIASKGGNTLFTTLLASCAALLYKLTGQDDIVIGIPIADRAMDGGESVVGHCIDFMPLRLQLPDDTSFEDHLARTQKAFLDAYEHRHLPFGRLVQKLKLPRDAGRMPLVAVTFNLQRLGKPLNFSGLEAELGANVHGFTNFDLSFNVTEVGGALRFDCRYRESSHAAGTIRRWLEHFQTLLENITLDPRQKLSELSLLTGEERRRMLFEWNGAKANFPCNKCVHQLFEEQASRTPDAIAVTFEGQSLSYAALNRRANRLSHQLRALGVGPEILVGLCLERSAEMVVCILAVLKAGGAYLPMEPAWPAERRAFALQDSQVPVLLTQKSLRDQFEYQNSGLKVLCVDDVPATDDPAHDENPGTGVRPENLAYVIYTSGSTGRPKGVLVTHQNVTRLFSATQPWYQFNEQDVWTLFHSIAFDFSVWEIWGALLYGGRLVVVPYLTSRSPEAFLELLASERVTVLNQTPSAFRQLMQAENSRAHSPQLALRLVIFGGEALEPQSLTPWFERHGDRRPQLVNMYGITETTVHVTYRPIGIKDLGSGSVIGAPIPDLQAYILNAHLQPVPVGVRGELYVGGAGVARGYLNRPELTAEKFIPDPFSSDPQARLYKTGDCARRLADGDIEYLGRIDNQVKIRGHRIELGEIEWVLNTHPAVRECAVVAREDSAGDKRLAAYVVTDPDKPGVASGELRTFSKAKLPDYMVPSAFVFLDALPLTPNGKLDRKTLPEPEQARPESDESFAAPQTATETALAEIWQEVLNLERAGVHDSFFELGGHSLNMTQVISRVREMFQVKLPVRRFFESPTISGLSTEIEKLLANDVCRLNDEEAGRLSEITD